jgi:hypothetical protein
MYPSGYIDRREFAETRSGREASGHDDCKTLKTNNDLLLAMQFAKDLKFFIVLLSIHTGKIK